MLQSPRFNKHAVTYTVVLTRGTRYAEILSPGKQSRCFPAKLLGCLREAPPAPADEEPDFRVTRRCSCHGRG